MSKHRIGVVTFPSHKSGNQPLSNLMDVIDPCSDTTTLITGNDGYALFKGDTRFHVDGIPHVRSKCLSSRIIRYLWVQIRISQQINRRRSSVDKWIFFFGGSGLLLPLITAKISKKRTALLLAGADIRLADASRDPLSCALKALSYLSYTLIDNFIVYSPNLITEWDLEPYRNKILITHRHFLDFETFTATTSLPNRPPLVGYIGRLSGEKGIQHFVQALPAILNDQRDLWVLIGGDGGLKESIEASLQEEGVTTRVDLPGWISHDDLPNYLNQLRLLVLPSYTEGLPNIMLEAMACGTPVLATPIGAVPDVIIDGKTGFIMENNSPECIAENVIRALNSPDLEEIAEAGRRFVEEHFTFERVVERWKEVLEEI
jgi:glycosyltransferase involved in cell wall biosynthesis